MTVTSRPVNKLPFANANESDPAIVDGGSGTSNAFTGVTATKVASGFTATDPFAHVTANGIFHRIGLWIEYLSKLIGENSVHEVLTDTATVVDVDHRMPTSDGTTSYFQANFDRLRAKYRLYVDEGYLDNPGNNSFYSHLRALGSGSLGAFLQSYGMAATLVGVGDNSAENAISGFGANLITGQIVLDAVAATKATIGKLKVTPSTVTAYTDGMVLETERVGLTEPYDATEVGSFPPKGTLTRDQIPAALGRIRIRRAGSGSISAVLEGTSVNLGAVNPGSNGWGVVLTDDSNMIGVTFASLDSSGSDGSGFGPGVTSDEVGLDVRQDNAGNILFEVRNSTGFYTDTGTATDFDFYVHLLGF